MKRQTKLVIQGYPGSFHDEVSRKYFGHNHIEIIPAKSFHTLSQMLAEDASINYGVMAIENSIAGSILQNYKLLREYDFWICGEEYLRIGMQLVALPGQTIADIHHVESHPMALYQVTQFFQEHRHISLSESVDTALSAKKIRDENLMGVGAIASRIAADVYDLDIIAADIETSKVNYTRFVIISRQPEYNSLGNADKASIYLRVPHHQGSLLKVLEKISDHRINISKLQSFPVMGEFNTYYFHLDLEFDSFEQYEKCIEEVRDVSTDLEELGVYKKAVIHDHQTV